MTVNWRQVERKELLKLMGSDQVCFFFFWFGLVSFGTIAAQLASPPLVVMRGHSNTCSYIRQRNRCLEFGGGV